jgi:hypothetical protein
VDWLLERSGYDWEGPEKCDFNKWTQREREEGGDPVGFERE